MYPAVKCFHGSILQIEHRGHSVFLGRPMGLCHLGILQWRFPQLHSFSKNSNISAMKLIANSDDQNFCLPRSLLAAIQWSELQHLISEAELSADQDDHWSYIWGSPIFFSKRAYSSLRGSLPASPLFKWLWNSKFQSRHKFFFVFLLVTFEGQA